ncbi:hypothetical protein RJD40_17020 [Vibrio scophthalmi]|uniref:hypothetical protein n=1 Tax=Vibrio scophthalmi TaxID=45658 RepID=UPI003AAA898B
MKYACCAVAIILLSSMLSTNVSAGCGLLSTQCLVIKQGQESTESCEITLCANTNEYIADWALANGGSVSERSDSESRQIKVNDQPGMSLPESILKSGLTCYATDDSQVIYCGKEVWL